MGKSIFLSKTFWVNAIVAIVSIATYMQDSALIANNPEIVAWVGTGVGLLNVVLRLVTNQAIK